MKQNTGPNGMSEDIEKFKFGTWYPIETHPTTDPCYFDAFMVMRMNGGNAYDEGVRRADVRWSLTTQRFEDIKGNPVEMIDGDTVIFITHWMPHPPPPSNGDRKPEDPSTAECLNQSLPSSPTVEGGE